MLLALTVFWAVDTLRAMKRWLVISAALLTAVGCHWLKTTVFPVEARDGRFEYDNDGNVIGKRPLPVRITEAEGGSFSTMGAWRRGERACDSLVLP